MITVEEVEQVDPVWWNSLVRSSSHGTIHQTTYWASYFERYYRARPYFLIARRAGTVRGLLLFFRMGRYPGYDASRPWIRYIKRPLNALLRVFRWYNGPVVVDPAGRAEVTSSLLNKVEELAARERIFALEHGALPVGSDGREIDTVKAAGFNVSEWGTFVVNLSESIEAIWARLKYSAAKSTVSRAIKLGLRVYDATDDPVDLHAQCEYEHGRANGIPPWPRAWLVAIRDTLAPVDAYHVFAAEYEGRLLAFTPVVFFNRTMHLIKPVQFSICKEQRIPAGDFLLWEAIKFGHEQGLEIFDLSGAAPVPSTSAELGIRFFKSKWGGKYVTYPILRKRYRCRRLS